MSTQTSSPSVTESQRSSGLAPLSLPPAAPVELGRPPRDAGDRLRHAIIRDMNLARPAIVSEAEFLSLPETMDRVELLDGEVIVTPSPTARHQTLLVRLVAALERWAQDHDSPVFVGLAPLDVRFAPGRILQPDAFVVLAEVATEQDGPLETIPNVCVEVLSTNRAYDRLTKRVVYAAAGVRELWIVEPSGLIERWHGLGLNEAEELTGVLRSTLLPGFELDLATLFRR